MKARYFVLAGIALILAAGSLLFYSEWEDFQAGRNARVLLMQMDIAASNEGIEEAAPLDIPAERLSVFQSIMDNVGNLVAPVTPAAAKAAPWYETVGVLSIPSLRLNLPVISETTDQLLNVSVCLYTYRGDMAEKPERMVINGHNNNSHFGRISKMAEGDTVQFTRNDGAVFHYAVTGKEEIDMTDIAGLRQGDWDMTLFTCNIQDRSRRILVRFEEIP